MAPTSKTADELMEQTLADFGELPVSDAAAIIEQRMDETDAARGGQPDPTEAPVAEDEDTPPEATPDEDEFEIEDDEEIVDEVEDEAEPEVEDEDEVEADEDFEVPDEDALHEVKVNGETSEVTYEELTRGYQTQAANTQNAMANAEEKRELQQRAVDMDAERGQLVAMQQAHEAALRALVPEEPDWNALTPDQKTEMMFRQRQLEQVQAEQQAVLARQSAEEDVRRADWIETESAKLLEAVPEWEDAGTRNDEITRMTEAAIGTYGFTPEDVASANDHRQLLMLRDAMRYRELLKNGPAVKKKTRRRKSPTMKGGRPKPPGHKKTKQQDAIAKAEARFKQTGKQSDAARLLELRMDAREG